MLSSPSSNLCNCQTAKPVDLATGNFWHRFNDFQIPGRGLALNLTHTYNAMNAAQDSPLGFGWTHSYNMFLTVDAAGTITVHEEGGTTVPFAWTGSAYQPPPFVFASLVNNGDGTLTFTRANQSKFTFSAPTSSVAGNLLRETDRNGYVTTLSYTNGRLTAVTDPGGRSLTLAYNASGRIAEVTSVSWTGLE
jgi:YD repeat-containing protein